ATVFNMNVLQSNSAGDVSLESITVMAQATPENGDEDPNYVYFEKIVAEEIYGTVWRAYGAIKIFLGNIEVPVGAEWELMHGYGVVGELRNCEGFAVARCDQNKVGLFFKEY
ncbi:MAG TPA: hypothetical protein VLZ83_11360, partial [Edaphocola sp.]|nr:hypothetical protein [Edaphocola sp.]